MEYNEEPICNVPICNLVSKTVSVSHPCLSGQIKIEHPYNFGLLKNSDLISAKKT